MTFIKIRSPLNDEWRNVNLEHVIEYNYNDGYTTLTTAAGTYSTEGDITKQIATVIKTCGGQHIQLKGE